MPALTKQSIINLLIDSPLREAIKINLVDIVNNTKDEDLSKVFPTINKELEIFQKATTRRLKLAEDTISKLSSEAPTASTEPTESTESTESTALKVPPLKLPPLPKPVASQDQEIISSEAKTPPLASGAGTPPVAPLTPPIAAPTPPKPFPGLPKKESSEAADEQALKDIQKELDSLKNDATLDAAPAAPAAAPAAPEPAKN